ncbi:MAG: 16S rRNA (uracil(1498)-N(3))-methyltransferase [Gammaproteobacteria bacterium]|nr:16S rRNA (uracil(1498)-N(3))-methyltransferase [Gammaproteobacteria bacterium]
MTIARIFQNTSLLLNDTLRLDDQASHHISRVLRSKVGDFITLFNGQGGEYRCHIIHIDKKYVTVSIKEFINPQMESSLELYLIQGISRGEKMDYTIQKAVELGVKKIIPLFTERSTVKLDKDRREKRLSHWQAIAIAACEQSGRNIIPEILLPESFENGLSSLRVDVGFVLSPHTSSPLSEFTIQSNQRVALLIGPEGGLTYQEIQRALLFKFYALSLGPRILRTETAAVAAITALQCRFGDMK